LLLIHHHHYVETCSLSLVVSL